MHSAGYTLKTACPPVILVPSSVDKGRLGHPKKTRPEPFDPGQRPFRVALEMEAHGYGVKYMRGTGKSQGGLKTPLIDQNGTNTRPIRAFFSPAGRGCLNGLR